MSNSLLKIRFVEVPVEILSLLLAAIRVSLATLLFYAAWRKIADPRVVLAALSRLPAVGRLPHVALNILILAEASVGILLLALPVAGGWAAAVMFAGFAVFLGLRKGSGSCGCLGSQGSVASRAPQVLSRVAGASAAILVSLVPSRLSPVSTIAGITVSFGLLLWLNRRALKLRLSPKRQPSRSASHVADGPQLEPEPPGVQEMGWDSTRGSLVTRRGFLSRAAATQSDSPLYYFRAQP